MLDFQSSFENFENRNFILLFKTNQIPTLWIQKKSRFPHYGSKKNPDSHIMDPGSNVINPVKIQFPRYG